ncbi:MAG: DUF1573 domain-containing protein [Flavobacteriales bacterium]|nr:DUF1573 domain-containing protein [Flavobacteriales bacterium]
MSNFLKLGLSLLLITVAGFSFAQNSIEFEKSTLKFEKVNEGEIVKLIYRFKNLGTDSLSIIPPEVDCSCTEVKIPEYKIVAGASDSLIVVFDTKDKIGFQERKITIQFVSDFMDSKSIDKQITFKGIVKATKATKEAYKNK